MYIFREKTKKNFFLLKKCIIIATYKSFIEFNTYSKPKQKTMKKITLLLGTALIVGAGALVNSAGAQAIRDRNVVPVAVNLNEVLRMTITNGGNIEFVFNSIDDYKLGLSADQATSQNPQDPEALLAANDVASGGGSGDAFNFYMTEFTVAASVRWRIEWGSEEATFIGTDDPTQTLALDNVGFYLTNLGTHVFEASTNAKGTTDASAGAGEVLFSAPTDNGNSVTALVVYPAADPLIEDNDDNPGADLIPMANAGDATENSFDILWRCGTTEAGNVAAPGPYNLSVVPMNAASLLNQGDIVPDRYVTNVLFELSRDF